MNKAEQAKRYLELAALFDEGKGSPTPEEEFEIVAALNRLAEIESLEPVGYLHTLTLRSGKTEAVFNDEDCIGTFGIPEINHDGIESILPLYRLPEHKEPQK